MGLAEQRGEHQGRSAGDVEEMRLAAVMAHSLPVLHPADGVFHPHPQDGRADPAAN